MFFFQVSALVETGGDEVDGVEEEDEEDLVIEVEEDSVIEVEEDSEEEEVRLETIIERVHPTIVLPFVISFFEYLPTLSQ